MTQFRRAAARIAYAGRLLLVLPTLGTELWLAVVTGWWGVTVAWPDPLSPAAGVIALLLGAAPAAVWAALSLAPSAVLLVGSALWVGGRRGLSTVPRALGASGVAVFWGAVGGLIASTAPWTPQSVPTAVVVGTALWVVARAVASGTQRLGAQRAGG